MQASIFPFDSSGDCILASLYLQTIFAISDAGRRGGDCLRDVGGDEAEKAASTVLFLPTTLLIVDVHLLVARIF